MKVKESEIRSCVAGNLILIDRNLILVREEYAIKFADGRKGFVDILAKDKFGCYSIIEIKKSNQTARSAIQQLYKYASFFKEKNRLEVSQIRCILVSTVWEELGAPFSEFKEFSDYDVKGYELIYKKNALPILNEVFPEFITGDNKPLGSFYFFRYTTKEIRDRNLEIFESILNNIPSINCITFSLNVSDGKEAIAKSYELDVFPFGIAWVVFTGNIDGIKSELSLIEIDSDLSDIDHYLATFVSEKEESRLRNRIAKLYLMASEDLGSFKGYAPHTLGNLNCVCDYDIKPIIKGPMFDDGLYSIDEAIDMARGTNGLHPYIFIAKTSPVRYVHFNTIRKDINCFLKHNKGWMECVKQLFSELDQNDEIDIKIYNPLNIFGLFNDLFVDGKSRRVPSITVNVTNQLGEEFRYYGTLFWDSSLNNINPLDGIYISYKDINTFRVRSVINTITEFDEKLSTYCGLYYGLLDLNSEKSYSVISRKWLSCELGAVKTVNDFVRANDEFVVEVGLLFKEYEIGIGTGTNMVLIDNS